MKRILLPLAAIIAAVINCPAQQPHNASYIADPAYSQTAPEERGEVITIKAFESQKYFPGTKRDISIYIPRQYDGKKAACLLVGLDGILMKATTALDYMIKEGEVPVIIGVFITPGRIIDGDKVVRYNRSNEWDTVSDRLASFIEDEILPLAESQVTSDGRSVRISRDANDRAIYGASSGGIAAFTAAWFRPDLYSRVYSGVGTFIAFRGGNEYPALIRKSEPKPIRVFLQDGRYDTWNPSFGDWFEQNQLMESALDFAGYEMNYKWDRGGHSITHGTYMFPDAMRWLWRGWPDKVKCGRSLNNYVQNIIDQKEEWHEIRSGLKEGASIVALSGGRIALQDGNAAVLLDSTGIQTSLRSLKKGENIIGAAADGSLLTSGDIDLKDAVRALVHNSGRMFVADRNGAIYRIEGRQKVKVQEGEGQKVDIAVYPDWSILAQGKTGTNWARSFVCRNGGLEFGQDFYYLHSDGGRMCFDTAGLLYVATPAGVQICDQNGRVRVIMSVPSGRVDDVALSGKKIWIISGGKLFVRTILHEGYVPCETVPVPKSEGEG